MNAAPEVPDPPRGRGRPILYPNSRRLSVQISKEMEERLWEHIRREPITPIVREALAYYLDALEAGRITRPGR